MHGLTIGWLGASFRVLILRILAMQFNEFLVLIDTLFILKDILSAIISLFLIISVNY
jgi:hypothetical protein